MEFKGLFGLSIFAVLLCVVAGCDGAANPSNVTAVSPTKVVDYKNGVYYFDYIEEDFANALSKFIADHPDLEFVDAIGNGSGEYGCNMGYFVVFRKKQLPAENPKQSTQKEGVMKKFKLEVSPTDGEGEFGATGRCLELGAENLEEAMKKARLQMKEGEDFYLIFVEHGGPGKYRCVYDFFNGTRIYQPA